MKLPLHRLMPILVLILGASFLTSCAAMQRASDKRRYIERELTKHVYQQDLDQVLPHARKILFREGFQVRDTSNTMMETEYLSNRDYEERYLVTATRAGKGWKVEFTLDRYNVRNDRSTTSRDFDMELALLRAVDPRRANEIEQKASAYANARS